MYNTDKIIERLNGNEFKQVEILNYDLLNHIMENSQRQPYKNYYDAIITQLAKETKNAIDFIEGFWQIAKNKHHFIQSICGKWDNIWRYIEKESNFTEEEMDSYLSDILAFADISDIEKINKKKELSNFISRHHNFLSIAPVCGEKRKQILLVLDVKFVVLDKLTSDQNLIGYVVERKLYEINPSTLATILGVTTDQLSYSSIQKTARKDVLDYIDAHIETYIKQVLLRVAIEEETEEALINILNRDKVSMDLKEEIIAEQPVVITDITTVIPEIWPVLVRFKKIDVSWSNVVAYFQEAESIDRELVDFLNMPEVAGELSKYNIGDASVADSDTVQEMSEAIIENQDLIEASFELLTNSIDRFSLYPIDSLPKVRVETMIIQGVLTLSPENFESLKSGFGDLFQLYLEENIYQFIESMDNYSLEHKDVVQLFHSKRIPEDYKIRLIEALDVASLSKEDTEFAEELADFILLNHVKLSMDAFDWLIDIEMRMDKKLMLISKRIYGLEFTDITELLRKLGEPYAEIAENGKRPQIKNNEVNRDFVQALDKKRYISSFSVNGKNIRINTRLKMEVE